MFEHIILPKCLRTVTPDSYIGRQARPQSERVLMSQWTKQGRCALLGRARRKPITEYRKFFRARRLNSASSPFRR